MVAWSFLRGAKRAGGALLAFLLVVVGLPLLGADAVTPGLDVQLVADPQGAVRRGEVVSYSYLMSNGTGSTLSGLEVTAGLPAGMTSIAT